MNQLFFVLCAVAVASTTPEHRTRDRQTPVPYPIPFGHVVNPYAAILPPGQQNGNLPPSHSYPYAFKAEPPSPYSSGLPYPSSPYSTSGPFKYTPGQNGSPSTYLPQHHGVYSPPLSYWPYPTQVFYASQYYPQPHHPHTPTHHVDNGPRPNYSTAKPLKPHNSYHIEISPPQHVSHNHEETNHPSSSSLHPQHSPIYHNTHEDSNHGPSHAAHTPLHPHPHDTPSHLDHSVHYHDTHGESNSNHYYPIPNTILTTEHLLQYLQAPVHLRTANPFSPPPQPPRIMILHPLETHSGGASVNIPENSGGNLVQSELPLSRRNTEDGAEREESPRTHVLWETMYRPIKWDHKWLHKWYHPKSFNLHHLWNPKWHEHWKPGKKEPTLTPHRHDPHLALEPWDQVTVHRTPPSSNPYYGLSHYPSKTTSPSNYPQLEDYYYEANYPHALDTYLQHDEPWNNRHLLEKLLQDNNKQAYQHTRDPAQYYHYKPGYDVYSLLGRPQLRHRPSSVPWMGAQGPDRSPLDPESRVLTDPSQLTPDEENPSPSLPDTQARLLEEPRSDLTADQHDVEPKPQPSSVDDVIEDSSMSSGTEPWFPPDEVQNVKTPSTSSEDVVEARPRSSGDSGLQPGVHPWLPPSYLYTPTSDEHPNTLSMTSRGRRSSTIARDASLT